MKDRFSFIVYSFGCESPFESGRRKKIPSGAAAAIACVGASLRVRERELVSCPGLKLVLMMHQSELLHNLAAS